MVFVTNRNHSVLFCAPFCMIATCWRDWWHVIIALVVEYFYFIISFYAYLFVTLQSQMKNRFQI